MTAGPSLATGDSPDAIVETATRYLPGFNIRNIEPSPIPGLHVLRYGPNIFYMSEDGRYIIRGDIIDVSEGRNLTEQARKDARIASIGILDEKHMIVFSPDEFDATITVFTDITCPYCAKFHEDVPMLNDSGIKVRYLAYPRVGIPSDVAEDMASVWCADDPRQALTDAKLGLGVEPAQCADPVKTHYAAGNSIGVEGTPTILLEDGSLVGGYVPYHKLSDAAIQAHAQVSE